jgi:signal peptidase I
MMMVVRAIGVTLYSISDTGLEPVFQAGDRVMVNRWSYGLRVGGKDSFFGYGRIARQSVEKGDLVAFENPQNNDEIFIYRCKGLPGDTIVHEGKTLVVPSLKDCADADYYWLETLDTHQLGFIAEEYLVGRAFMVVYSRNPLGPFWKGWRSNRILLSL